MIVTRPKPPESILERLAPHREVAVIGCGLCATTCGTGGRQQVEDMARFLAAGGKTVLWTEVVDGVCLRMLTRKTVAPLVPPPAVVVMACGSGAQTVAGLLESASVVPALDSLFLGSVQRVGRYEEKCVLCGDCVVGDFNGLCPVTLCPKGLQNGPCGGMDDGKCETDPESECVWHRIWEAKAAAGRLADLDAIRPPRSRRRNRLPRP